MTTVYFLCTYVGPRLEGGPSAATEPTTIVGGPPTREAERVLRQVERNLTVLTSAVPMVEIEDLSPLMQPHIVGVPRTWVHLFRHLENVVVHYGRANRPRPYLG
jgi:hypothetical protein